MTIHASHTHATPGDLPGRAPVTSPTRLRVLQSFGEPSADSNPYVQLLTSSIPADVDVQYFTWRRAFALRYNVLHLHWPEHLFRGAGGRVMQSVRFVAFLVLFASVWVSGRVVVQTAHNVSAHDGSRPHERLLLLALRRCTAAWIHLNDATPTAGRSQVTLIPHGDYRSWFDGCATVDRHPGRVLFFGLVRPYKGVEQLLAAFRGTSDEVQLRVAGRPSTPAYASTIRALADGLARAELRLEHLSDDDLALEISAADLVVLPYREMHNSGSLLLALSLDRPVLVPDGPVTRALRDEVGRDWVHLFSGPLTAEHIEDALRSVAMAGPGSAPDLSRRAWPAIGRDTATLYRAAAERRLGRRS